MRSPSSGLFRLTALLLSIVLALPIFAYDYPLTSNAIRDAYFLGSRQGGTAPHLLKQYSRRIGELHQGNCTSEIRIETPFLQIVEYVGSAANYTSQDAVKEFYGRPMQLHIFLDLCYMREAPPPNSVKLKFIQNKKEVFPDSDVRTAYAERFSETSFLLPNGEKAELKFAATRLDASTLTILIDTADGQHTQTDFDLQSVR